MGVPIVLAEDDADLRAVYATCLRSAGYEIWEAADGVEALELIGEKSPTLLVLDVWMPRLNGFEVLERLREDPRSMSLKVVVLSNVGDSDSRLESFAAGVTDYWVKGLALSDLLGRVQGVLLEVEESLDPPAAPPNHDRPSDPEDRFLFRGDLHSGG